MNRCIKKRLGLTVILSFFTLMLMAQDTASSASSSIDQTMRSHDKIYVVMAVCLVILIAFFLYLIRIDLKVSKKEKLS